MVAGINSRTRIVRMLEVRRKLHTSVDHVPATPVWLFASEHSASSLHTWELHSARFAKLNTISKKVVIPRFFVKVFTPEKSLFWLSETAAAKYGPSWDRMEHGPRDFLGGLPFIQLTLARLG